MGEQLRFLQKFGQLTTVDRANPVIKVGDPVYYDFYGDGKYDHVAICTGINKQTGKPIVYDHSSSKLIKDFDELDADVIATIHLPDMDAEDRSLPLILSNEDTEDAVAEGWRPTFYMINWDPEEVDYEIYAGLSQKDNSGKGIFIYDGCWYVSLDGQTALNCGRVRNNQEGNRIVKLAMLQMFAGEKNLYLTDEKDSSRSVNLYLEENLDETVSTLDGRSYYYDPSDGTWKDLALRYDIGVSVFDSDQISSIITVNRKDETDQKKAFLSFDGVYASAATSFELKSDTNSFNRFEVEKNGRQTVYITDWDPAGADFDLYIDNGGKETSYYRYNKSAGKQLRVGYFAYDNKWYFTGDGQTAVYKHECYYGGKLVLPGEGERGFQRSGSGDWIYVGSNGEKVRNQFVTQGNKKFYLNSDGVLLQSGWVQIGGVRYYADENGVIQTETRSDTIKTADKEKGVQPKNGNKKTTGGSGTVPAATDLSGVIHAGSGEITEGNILLPQLMRGSRFSGRTVQVNTALLNGWVEDNHNRYYYRTGIMQHGWLTYDHDRYYLDLMTGIMQTGWKNIEDDWYYFNADGTMQTGLAEIEGKNYYFDEDGVMQTGWVEIDGKWYYFDENGVMQIGWAEIDEKWYYFDEEGVMQTRWLTLDDKTYYLGTDGVRVSGSQTIDEKEYEFDDDGVLTSGEMEK